MSITYFSNVRCIYPNLTAPYISKKFPNSPANFTIDLVDIDPQDVKLREFMQNYAAMAQAEWGVNAPQVMQMIQSDKRARCFGMGPEKVNEETFKPVTGYGQGVWINCKNKNQPQIIKPDGSPAANQMEAMELARKIYGGCYINIAIKPWLRKTNRGISCEVIAVQFAKDGEPLGGSSDVDVTPMFGAVAAPASAPAAPAFAMPGLPSFM
jgi:Protein of unknown function (DUF2815)